MLTRGAGVQVGVVDSGVSPRGGGLPGAVLAGRAIADGTHGDSDCLGRGTALAALVAARPVSGSLFVGVAPASVIYPVRIVDERGDTTPTALAAGIQAAARAGCKVILVAVGVPTPDPLVRAAVKYAVGHDAVVVAALAGKSAGDDSSQQAPSWYPASDPDVLAVGGVDQAGALVQPVSARSGLDLLAPGDKAFSVGPSGTGNYVVGGAAVAAAYVAGAAALVRAYHPSLDQAHVRQRLLNTADNANLDLYAAVSAPDMPDGDTVPPRPQSALVMAHAAGVPRSESIASIIALAAALVVAVAWLGRRIVAEGRRRRWRRP
ncbi:S8 family serine peptidase [Actinoplanes sp. NPDC051343]|uniref:S8 family serine peptidase n=1 Tax=Actinoplanes sp. NPDC051343 TaxID=3363906 RepID=UPI0037ADD93F